MTGAQAVLPPNQYQIASFSSYAGATISTAYDAYYGWGGSYPNGIVATSGSGYYYWPTADLYVNFAIPVSGLTFRLIGSQAGGASGYIDVYVNNSYYTSTSFHTGDGWPGQVLPPYTVNLSGIPHITAIAIRYVTNYDYSFYSNYPLYYDDFTFTPELFANIINPRVNGGLDQTTQNALLGGDVVLQASTSHPGGAYAWSFTPDNLVSVVSGSRTSSSITIRSTDIGTINAKLTYTRNGVSVSPSFTLNSVLPTLISFTGQQTSDRINPPGGCSGHYGLQELLWFYDVGCPDSEPGMSFLARVQAPTTFISDPMQSGVKFVQAVSIFQKRMDMGLRCWTTRTNESDVASGWRLDVSDPMSRDIGAIWYFSILGSPTFPGNELSIATTDSPGTALTTPVDYLFRDALYEDDRFETYVVYFTGADPAQPRLQRPIGKLTWNWGGLVVFDWNGSNAVHNLRYSISSAGTRIGGPANSMVTMQGAWFYDPNMPCPGGPPIINNKLDSGRFFVRQHYLDFLLRDPNGDPGHDPDPLGWGFWTTDISQCVFDLNCVRAQRIHVGVAFISCDNIEFIEKIRAVDANSANIMANCPGRPGFDYYAYNREFVRWCYKTYLQREPDPEGWDFWTNDLNSNGNYAHTIDAFQVCEEYRNRPRS